MTTFWDRIFPIDQNVSNGVNNGAELRNGDFWRILDADFVLPVLGYAMFWAVVQWAINEICWLNMASTLRRQRLINITTSLVHSTIIGFYVLIYVLRYPYRMFHHVAHYYDYADSQIVHACIGYFAYDFVTILRHERHGIVNFVLLVHHLATIFVLCTALLPRKFLLYAYWALLMEVSSVFLHIRTLMHLTRTSQQYPIIARFVSVCNVIGFVVFRFFVQAWQVPWCWRHRHLVSRFFVVVGVYLGALFFAINCCLFIRVLMSDRFIRCGAVPLIPGRVDSDSNFFFDINDHKKAKKK